MSTLVGISLVKTSSNGNPVFDCDNFRFMVEYLGNSTYAYVNHKDQLCLTEWGNRRAAEGAKDQYLAFAVNIDLARQRYLKHFPQETENEEETPA